MEIKVKASTMVKPMTRKPSSTLWLSNVDVVFAACYHIRTLYFYCSTGAVDFFDSDVLKDALSSALDDFYPIAGRLKTGNNRTGIECNGEGALFVEAEADGAIEELGDFTFRPELSLIPVVDYSKGIETYPILMLQITRFKCGGICLGAAIEHQVADGFSFVYFINSWAEMSTRCSDFTTPRPLFDRGILAARNPPDTSIHVESQGHILLKSPQLNSSDSRETLIMCKVFKLTPDQLNALKSHCREEEDITAVTYTTYEALAGHLWRCFSNTGGVPEDEEISLCIPVDGRRRLRPPPPKGYFGNLVFSANPVVLGGELKSKPLKYTVRKIHEAIARMDDQRFRSSIDYMENLQCDVGKIMRNRGEEHRIMVNSWAKLRFYDADFGWGKPVYVGLGEVPQTDSVFVLPSPTNDGSLLCAISMPREQFWLFEKLLYDI